ncbi:MAG: Uncharacterised protein [Prochlorococcus marinus str. MIT 9215]|nr:MAG: Uncharacterised protein [Prochlorococcus marinus str. MIT 9215]
MLMTPSSDLESFLNAVVRDHSIATGLKALTSHPQIAAYAKTCGYEFSLAEWGRYVASEALNLSDQDLGYVMGADVDHWTWAFKQVALWRALLMDGSRASDTSSISSVANSSQEISNPMLGAVDSSSAALADAQQDSQLEAFVAFAKQDSAVKEEIKMATNEVDVIRIAQENGFSFDSRAILRQWSKVTDFSRPTWFGWFAE